MSGSEGYDGKRSNFYTESFKHEANSPFLKRSGSRQYSSGALATDMTTEQGQEMKVKAAQPGKVTED